MKQLQNLPLLTLAYLFGASSLALAAPIPINNASFERPELDPGGWNNPLPDPDLADTGPDWVGQNGASDSNTFIEFIPDFSSEGNQHLGMQGNYYAFQNTGVPWEANTTYTLTVGVGNRSQNPGAMGIIGLTSSTEDPGPDNTLPYDNADDALENDPQFLSGAVNVMDLGSDDQLSFTDYAVEFTTGSLPPSGNVVVFLGDEGPADRAHFDNVRLESEESEVGVNPLDPDGDGIFTQVELKHGLDPEVADADSDHDGDGVIASVEIFELGTLANDPDFDKDGLNDGIETNTGTYVDATNTGTDPKNADTDRDGLSDGVETNTGAFVSAEDRGTNPLVSDSDEDGTADGKEVATGFDPLDSTSAPAFPVPIGYWPFDDQGATVTADLGPSGITSMVNGDPEWVAGHSGEPSDFAIKFDGEDDSVTTDVSLLNDLPNLTMSLWVRMEEEQPGGRAGLVGQNDAVEYGMINPTTMQWWSPAGSFDADFGPVVDEWTHVAVVLDDVGYTVYANGEVLGGAEGGGPVSSGDTLNIGGDGIFDNTGNFFLGEIDDVAIWDEALSVEQIQELANKEKCPLGACGSSGFDVAEITRASDGMVSLTWGSFPGKFYDIEASPNMSTGSWQPMATDIAAEGGEALLTSAMIESNLAATMEYFRVVQVDAPPFIEQGFEDGIGDWTTSGSGTPWEFGVPSNGPGTAKSGAGVAAVGLTGNYADSTQAILRTPVIDPLGVSGRLTLDFAYYLNATDEEGGQIAILEADGTQIQNLEPLYIGGEDGNTADWTDASIRLPALDPVRPFILQFSFLSLDDGEENNGEGWFIDDVRVSK